ncbi:MAG: GMC family oxidoreductase N-terminal domain-containing protein [Thermodesulfobacteriota bacterium]
MADQRKPLFDAIIIGSGPGGAAVARELSQNNWKVLVLEWGSGDPLRGTIPQAASMILTPGKGMLFTYKGLSMVRGIVKGGSSVFYYSTAFDPPHDMLKKHGMDVRAEVAEIRSELPIAPLSDELMGPMAKRLMKSAQDLGYSWKKLDKYVFQDLCRKDCDKCNLGCPYGAKWTARNWIDESVKNGATFVPNARVRYVLQSGNKAEGVVFTRNGKEMRAYAPVVILAAGGIGTPVILRASGIAKAGYDYFFDPLICVWGEVSDMNGGREFPMASGVHMEDEGYLMTDMTIPKTLYQAFAAEVMRFDRLHVHSRTLSIMVKAKDSLGGALTDSGGVRKRLADYDQAKLMKGYERAKGILKNAGAKNIFKSWYIAAHPGGTAKVGDVVDSNLETEIKNLYVCDCAAIPEAWGLPPSLTLLAMGKQLGRKLAVKHNKGRVETKVQAA